MNDKIAAAASIYLALDPHDDLRSQAADVITRELDDHCNWSIGKRDGRITITLADGESGVWVAAKPPTCWCGAMAEYVNPASEASDIGFACYQHTRDGCQSIDPTPTCELCGWEVADTDAHGEYWAPQYPDRTVLAHEACAARCSYVRYNQPA